MPEKNQFFGSTFAERKKLREAEEKNTEKAVKSDAEEVEDKAVKTTRSSKRS